MGDIPIFDEPIILISIGNVRGIIFLSLYWLFKLIAAMNNSWAKSVFGIFFPYLFVDPSKILSGKNHYSLFFFVIMHNI